MESEARWHIFVKAKYAKSMSWGRKTRLFDVAKPVALRNFQRVWKRRKFASILRSFIFLNPSESISSLKPCSLTLGWVLYSLSPGRILFFSIILLCLLLECLLQWSWISTRLIIKLPRGKFIFVNFIALRTPHSKPKASNTSLLFTFLSSCIFPLLLKIAFSIYPYFTWIEIFH